MSSVFGKREPEVAVHLGDVHLSSIAWAELTRTASLRVADRATIGLGLYPLGCLVLGLPVARATERMLVLGSIVALVAISSAIRLWLSKDGSARYLRNPGAWRSLFAGTTLLSVGGWAFVSCWTLLELGFLHPQAFLTLIITLALAAIGPVVYHPWRGLAESFLFILLVPHLPLLPIVVAPGYRWSTTILLGVLLVYMLVISSRLRADFWRENVNGWLLARRAAEIEAARRELDATRADARTHVQRRTGQLELARAALEADLAQVTLAREQLRESEERFRQLADNVEQVFWIVQLEPREVLYASPSFETIWGRSREELYADANLWYESLSPEYRPVISRAYSDFQLEIPVRAEYQIRRPDGELSRWICESAYPVRDDEGRTFRLAGHSEDITLQKETELAFYRREKDYRTIFEDAHDAIVVFDPDGETVLNANQRACEVYGFEHSDFVGMSLEKISMDPASGREHVRETLERGRRYHFEATQKRADGNEILVEINASVIEYEGRQAILSINRDVTHRSRAEALRVAKEAAERANEAKSMFLANMSHEIRTPIAGIIGIARMLGRRSLDVESSHDVELLRSSAEGMLDIIDDVLDLARIERGAVELGEVAFAIKPLTEEVVGLLAKRAEDRGVTLELCVDDVGWVWGAGARIRQVMLNLVGNAIKFTESGRVAVRVSELDRGEETVRVRFEVEDTGIGIPAESLEGIFDPFDQVDGSSSRKYGGSGLGLAISSRLIESMGGRIEVESEEGVGSRFSFELHLPTDIVGLEEEPTKAPSASEEALRERRAGFAVLLAEDDPVNRLVARRQVEALGYRVELAVDGSEALEALREGVYDLVLMDCQMPRLDGFEATRRIRAGEVGSVEVPIVALTAHAMKGDRARCLEAGMDDYLSKPFEESHLARLLDRWIFEERSTAAAQAGEEPR